jgi:hypothetical protein
VPADNEKQRELFAIAEHRPDQLYKKNATLASQPHSVLHEFASSVAPKGFAGIRRSKQLGADRRGE